MARNHPRFSSTVPYELKDGNFVSYIEELHRLALPQNIGRGGIRKARYMLSCTWNAPLNAFVAPEEFFEGKGIDAVLMPSFPE